MNDFLLINSPMFWSEKEDNENYLSPLGLAYIATYLKRAGVKVELVDCVKENIGVDNMIKRILDAHPKAIGINIFTQNYKLVKFIVENINDSIIVFIGGPAVKSLYSEIINWQAKNTINIVIGEGEFIIPAIFLNNCCELPKVINDKRKVFTVNKKSIYFPNDISEISLDRSFIKNEIIINHYGQKEAAIVTSRGCIYNCAFCGGAKSLNEDIPARIRSTDSVKKEIQEIINIYPSVQSVRVLDDLFLKSKNSIINAKNVFSNFPQVSWRGMAHILSFKDYDKELSILKESNCKELFVGIESGSNRIRKKINKLGTAQNVIDVATKIMQHGIDLKGYFIYGFPDETEYDFQETYKLACILKDISKKTTGDFRTSVFQFRPYHGTQLYNEIIEKHGKIQEYGYNSDISVFAGRNQFNFDFGNFSMETKELLNEYIIKTQMISESY